MTHKSLPSAMSDLLLRAERMAQGLETHGPWLSLTQIPAEEFRRVLNQLRDADATWVVARSAKASAQKRVSTADEALTAWLAKARLVVMLARGAKWSERWIETGFTHQGTNVPKRIELRITLAHRLVVFLALHPDFGVPFAEVTAARGRPIYERMIHTRDALELANNECMISKRQRDAAERVLRRMMRDVIVALDSTIAPGDPRWLAFGLYWPVRASKRQRNVQARTFSETSAGPIQLPTKIQSGSERTVAA
jgi:hypothetical protein